MKIDFRIFVFGVLGIFAIGDGSSAKIELVFDAKPNEVVVRLRESNSLSREMVFKQMLGKLGGSAQGRLLQSEIPFAVVSSQSIQRESLLKSANRLPEVLYAEPNYIYHSSRRVQAPDDSEFSKLWGLLNTGSADQSGQRGKVGSDIHVTKLWDEGIRGNKAVKVAVVDTGIDSTHPDLAANVDAAHGFNFVNHTADSTDDVNHGSHCSGTIGGVANNALGIAGVNWSVTLIPVKFLDSSGSGTLDSAVEAIHYANTQGVNIINASWGGGPFTQALYDVIAESRDHGILFVAAAGNESRNTDSIHTYPANYQLDNIISVAAVDNQDHLASFSNYGKATVHVAAPGVGIYSTEAHGRYGYLSGTSMAAPHVSGVAALLLSQEPELTYSQVKERLMKSSDPVHVLENKVASGGRINAYNALHSIFPTHLVLNEADWKDVESHIESKHPYASGTAVKFMIKVPKARYIRVFVEKIDTIAYFDTLKWIQSDGEVIESWSGTYGPRVSDYLEGSEGALVLKGSDTTSAWGFKVSKVQAIY